MSILYFTLLYKVSIYFIQTLMASYSVSSNGNWALKRDAGEA